MGKGKGATKYWSFLIKKNQSIFEFIGCKKKLIQKIIKPVKRKIPLKTTIISKFN
jgi:ribosomal protein L16/L10AE